MGHGRSGYNSALFPPPGAINLHEEQNQLPTVVSTGLHLSSASIPPILSEDLAVQIKRENDEIEQFINAQVASISILLSDCFVSTQHRRN